MFFFDFSKIISHYKKIGYNISVNYDRLHAWMSTQLRLTALLSSLITRGGLDLRLYDSLSIDERVGASCCVWSGPTGFNC